MKILITRPQPKADELKQLCVEKHIEAKVVPLLKITPLAPELWQAELKKFKAIDALIFVSTHAVEYFCKNNFDPALKQLPTFTPGKSTAELLIAQGFTQVIYPHEQENSETLLALPELQNVTGKHFVIIRAIVGRELIAETLNVRGAHINYLAVYEVTRSVLTPIERTILDEDFDVVVLTSMEALRYFLELRKPQQEKITVLPGPMKQLAQTIYKDKILMVNSFNNAHLIAVLMQAFHHAQVR
jgi:uroporphyrinogen-III synthase